ncbi:hypothetical protein K1T71_008401 [Dendrolimus kikuchii]|uniref:Uncharacterized protein n=1 Tax=Dendrolimus kikuchii TaxID=765133 RepID=A0ACC1CYM5_9NEOP|nr:hypothetical protein K1T71_008401 [Dendrolimus kikuchii]
MESIEKPSDNHELKSGTDEGDKIETVEESATCSKQSMRNHIDYIKSTLDSNIKVEKKEEDDIKHILKPGVKQTQNGNEMQLKDAGEVGKIVTRKKRKPQKRKLKRRPNTAKAKKSRRDSLIAMYVGKLSNVVPFQRRRILPESEDSLSDSDSDLSY